MTPHSVVRLFIRLALVLAVWLGLPFVSAAQTIGSPSSIADSQSPHDDQTHQGGTSPDTGSAEYPSLHVSGFGNADFAAQNKSEGPRGFSEGQFVLHLVSALSTRVNVFSELS